MEGLTFYTLPYRWALEWLNIESLSVLFRLFLRVNLRKVNDFLSLVNDFIRFMNTFEEV